MREYYLTLLGASLAFKDRIHQPTTCPETHRFYSQYYRLEYAFMTMQYDCLSYIDAAFDAIREQRNRL